MASNTSAFTINVIVPAASPCGSYDLIGFSVSDVGGEATTSSSTINPTEALTTCPFFVVPPSVNVCCPGSNPTGKLNTFENFPSPSVVTVPSSTGSELTHTSTTVFGAKPSPPISTVRPRYARIAFPSPGGMMVPSAFRGMIRTINSSGNSITATPSCATVTMRSTTFSPTTTAPLPGGTAIPPLPGSTSRGMTTGCSVEGVLIGKIGFGTIVVVVVGVIVVVGETELGVGDVTGLCGDAGSTMDWVLTVATAPGPAEFTARTPTW